MKSETEREKKKKNKKNLKRTHFLLTFHKPKNWGKKKSVANLNRDNIINCSRPKRSYYNNYRDRLQLNNFSVLSKFKPGDF